jgi:hypothetical protein
VCVGVCVCVLCVRERSNVMVMSLCMTVLCVRPLFPWPDESIAKRIIRPGQDDQRRKTHPTNV